jgi:hypothetical protein
MPIVLPRVMECCVMSEDDYASMIETKEEDVYDQRKPEGIKKEGEGKDEEDYEIDLQAENC